MNDDYQIKTVEIVQKVPVENMNKYTETIPIPTK
jgi:hypothetical protein